nr:M14 metallopeptidase family protein [Polymorphobacter sp.]
MRRHLGGTLLAVALSAIAVAASATDAVPTTATITDPAVVLKVQPGADYFLANYTQISTWLHQIAGESDRMKLVSIGKTAEGRDQLMAIISSPENIRNLDRLREISRKLALAKGLTDDEAHRLATEGRAVVWMDAGLHATEVVPAQSHIEMIHEMLTRNDPETLRLLGDDVMLFVFANPDGLDLVANWYMRPTDPAKRATDTIPVLYQKYIGHDDNRDSFASTQPETTNMNRAAYREWFPQILYNQHQTGPLGAVVFIPPFRDPYNFNNEPLVINQTDIVGGMMHARLVAQGKGGSVMRSGAPYSTWFNGGVRTIGYFHNQIGILTEIIGNPTPMDIPLVPSNQLAREDEVMPIAPQKWHFQQSLDYMKEMDRAILDYASRYRETVLFNRYIMGRNEIAKGSTDSWIVTPKRIEAMKTAAAAIKTGQNGAPLDASTGNASRDVVPTSLYQTVLHDPATRAPRAYIIPGDRQPDLPTTIKFLNALIKTGIEVERADAPFNSGGATYPAGSFVVRTDQAFRPHVLDMFEPQDHPQDFAYPGGPPIRPYDVTGYTLALQMNVRFDRVLEPFAPTFPVVPDVIDTPPAGHIVGEGRAGFVVSHATNNSFTLSNRLLKARLPVFWLKAPTTVAGATLAPGALWIPGSARAKAIVTQSIGPLGIDAYAVDAKPAGETITVKAARIGLVDVYGGSMASGWTRWLFDQFEFPYTRVYPQELDKGGLNRKYDVLILQSDVLGREEGGGRDQPKPGDIPAEYHASLGRITADRTYPAIASFASAGGTVIAVGDASRIGPALGVPVKNILVTAGTDGKDKPISSSKFYVPGSIVTVKVDVADPLAYGVPETVNMFYNNNPVFSLTAGTTVHQVASYYNDDPLVSGWAWGQKLLNGNASIVDATVGRGRVYLLGGEVTQRGQPYATFKFLFNGIFAGPGEAHRGS